MHTSGEARRGAAGYALIEMMVVVSVIGILGAMAVFQIGAARPSLVADGGMRVIMAQLNTARETALTQRRQIEIAFPNDTIRLTRRDVPNGTTVLTTVGMEGGVRFSMVDGIDTPDAFGKTGPLSFGAAATVMFGSDGMLIDGGGSPINGTVFLAVPHVPHSFRAVTIHGSTGRVRAYRWNGASWSRV